jgi:hypothetical protein
MFYDIFLSRPTQTEENKLFEFFSLLIIYIYYKYFSSLNINSIYKTQLNISCLVVVVKNLNAAAISIFVLFLY